MSGVERDLEKRELARRLVAYEVSLRPRRAVDRMATNPVLERLRIPLTTLVGAGGLASLLTRAVKLARRENPAFAPMRVKDDGTLDGMEGEAAEAEEVIVAHLLGLLTTFIGDTLTIRLLRTSWPEMPDFNNESNGAIDHE